MAILLKVRTIVGNTFVKIIPKYWWSYWTSSSPLITSYILSTGSLLLSTNHPTHTSPWLISCYHYCGSFSLQEKLQLTNNNSLSRQRNIDYSNKMETNMQTYLCRTREASLQMVCSSILGILTSFVRSVCGGLYTFSVFPAQDLIYLELEHFCWTCCSWDPLLWLRRSLVKNILNIPNIRRKFLC